MSLKQLNILLADDDLDDCLFFKEALEGMPVNTHLTAVHDGEQLMQLQTEETFVGSGVQISVHRVDYDHASSENLHVVPDDAGELARGKLRGIDL